ncbi:hypothetical protein WKI68_11040 [Streptomyces sp. MS1.HAVA.3]|uniref:histidine kinase n=1 Tax=Streptomyces caledonius TaxID=3134107 RepID=A0ABU8U2V8_9ACTN
MATLNIDLARTVLTRGEAKAAELQTEVAWLIGGSGGGLLAVVVVVVFTTRSVLRRLHELHERTVTVADRTLPDVVARLQRGQSVDAEALPAVTGDGDEVGRISDAFARAVAVSVDGHRQLAAERHGFGLFASGIASRTGNLVSRQLSLTEDLQDTFGHDEALLAQLMRADQLTVGMRRQIENLLILAGGEVPTRTPSPCASPTCSAKPPPRSRTSGASSGRPWTRPAWNRARSARSATCSRNSWTTPPGSPAPLEGRHPRRTGRGRTVGRDRGLRAAGEPQRYEEMNGRLHQAPPYSVLAQNAHRLGLFVVGHLADQLQATVTLRRSVYGGTSAVVILPGELLVATGAQAPREPERPAPAPAPEPPTPTPAPAAATPAEQPEPAGQPEREPVPVPEPVPHTSAGLPSRRAKTLAPVPAARPAPADGPARPALPERVPQTHIADQLRAPRAPETAVRPDTATPEEVADAWADYEQGTQTVEEELRRDQP